MAAITHPPHKEGDFLVDYEEKVFEDVKATPGEKALVTFHTVAFEGSIGLVNMLQATRLMRKGFETSVLLYGPGVMLGVQRGFPKLGSEAFPGHLVVNQKIGGFMAEGGKVYACRFALQALYGQTEAALIPGIRPINPLDVLDLDPAAPQGQRRSSSTPGRCKGERGGARWPTRKVRAAAVQLAPGARQPRGHDREGLRRDRRGRARGRRAGGLPRDGRPLLPVLLVHPAARGDGRGAPASVRGGGDRARARPPRRSPRRRARPARVVVLGVNERDHGTLYNAQLMFDADGRLVLHRRKITPTYPRAHGLGPGRRLRAARGRHARRAHRRARLLGALQPARALRADGRPRGDPRGHVPGLAGRRRSSPSRSRSPSATTRSNRAASWSTPPAG